MLEKSYPYYLANKAVKSHRKLDVIDKYSGKVATRVALPDPPVLDKAIGAAHDATLAMKRGPTGARAAWCGRCVAGIST